MLWRRWDGKKGWSTASWEIQRTAGTSACIWQKDFQEPVFTCQNGAGSTPLTTTSWIMGCADVLPGLSMEMPDRPAGSNQQVIVHRYPETASLQGHFKVRL